VQYLRQKFKPCNMKGDFKSVFCYTLCVNFGKSLSPYVLQLSVCKMDIIAFTYPWGYCEDSFIRRCKQLARYYNRCT